MPHMRLCQGHRGPGSVYPVTIDGKGSPGMGEGVGECSRHKYEQLNPCPLKGCSTDLHPHGLPFPHPTLGSPIVAKGFGVQAAMDRESQNWDLRHIPPASTQILETKEIGLKSASEISQF